MRLHYLMKCCNSMRNSLGIMKFNYLCNIYLYYFIKLLLLSYSIKSVLCGSAVKEKSLKLSVFQIGCFASIKIKA